MLHVLSIFALILLTNPVSINCLAPSQKCFFKRAKKMSPYKSDIDTPNFFSAPKNETAKIKKAWTSWLQVC